jgi:hypothetical protein
VPGEVSPLLYAINQLLGRLDSVLTLQSRFISDAAHQLKTPIAALDAQFEVALREDDPAHMREAMHKLRPGLERLSRLVTQLLSLARNEPEAVRAVTLTPVDLNAAALEAATAWVPEALKKGIDLGFEGTPKPVSIRGDSARLRELLDNLLDNAIRYTTCRRPGYRARICGAVAGGRGERRRSEHTAARARACVRALSPPARQLARRQWTGPRYRAGNCEPAWGCYRVECRRRRSRQHVQRVVSRRASSVVMIMSVFVHVILMFIHYWNIPK